MKLNVKLRPWRNQLSAVAIGRGYYLQKSFLKDELHEYLLDQCVGIIDPGKNFRISMQRYLNNLDIKNIICAKSIEEFERLKIGKKIGFFIVEWELEGQNGIEFCRQLRKNDDYKNTPYLLLTTESKANDVVLASEVELDGYLVKPFSYETFCKQMFSVLRNKVNPSELNTKLGLANEKLANDELDEAEKIFQEVTTEFQSARAICGIARVREQKGQPKEALEQFRLAAKINPHFIDPHREILRLCEILGDVSGVTEAALYLHNQSPENPRYTLILAKCYLVQDLLVGSEEFFQKTIMLSPKLAEAYKGLGTVQVKNKHYEKALKSFKRSLDLDETDVGTINSLGMTLVKVGKLEEAIERYSMALRLDPRNPQVLFNIGFAYEKHGGFDKAKWYYAQSLIHKPDFEKAQRRLDIVEHNVK